MIPGKEPLDGRVQILGEHLLRGIRGPVLADEERVGLGEPFGLQSNSPGQEVGYPGSCPSSGGFRLPGHSNPRTGRALTRPGLRVDVIRALEQIVDDFTTALAELDASRPVGRGMGKVPREFKPGIGPLSEAETIKRCVAGLRENDTYYADAAPLRYVGSRSTCDLVIPGEWSIEFKQIRPFGDNGVEAEHWSQNALHPYPGHVSSLGDAMKLRSSDLTPRKAIIIFGYEHSPALLSLDPVIQGFELLATQLLGFQLGPRIERRIGPLVHPVHQVGRVFAWELMPTG